MDSRIKIRDAIQAGKVTEATSMVHQLYPELLDDDRYLFFHLQVSYLPTLESRINEQVVYWKMEKNPTYTHLFGTIRLSIFSKKSHLYFY